MRQILLCLISTALTIGSAFGQASPVDAFKGFLASPPPIARIVYTTREFHEPYPGAPKVDTNVYRYFAGKRQDTDFVLREVLALDQLDDPATLTDSTFLVHGKNGSTFWSIVRENYVYWEDKQLAYSTNYVPFQDIPANEGALREISATRSMLLRVLNMGISELKPGTFKWNGNSFTAEMLDHQPLYGNLEIENGLPKALHIGIANMSNINVIGYSYDNKQADLLPGVFIQSYVFSNGVSMPMCEYKIISLEIASSKIPLDAFSAKSFQVDSFTQTLRAEGTNLYWKNPIGKTINITTGKAINNGSAYITPGNTRLFLPVMVLLATASAGLFCWIYFRKAKQDP